MPSNFNRTTPVAPTGRKNVKWQTDGAGNDSAYYDLFSSVNPQTGTSYAIKDSATTGATDRGTLVTLKNAGAVAVSIGQAGGSSLFPADWFTFLLNLGAGTVTLTPTTSTVNGAATLTLATNQWCILFSDGANYEALVYNPAGGGVWGSITGTLSAQTDLQTALNLLAPLANAALTGNPTAPTQTALNNSTRLATTAYADAAVAVEKAFAQSASNLTSGVVPPTLLPLADVAPGTGITFKNAASIQGTGAVSQTATIAITAAVGQTIVVVVSVASGYSFGSPADNGGNSYSMLLQKSVGTGTTLVFVCLNARTAATLVQISLGSASTYSAAAAVYGGVKSVGALNNNTNSGTTAGTISLTSTVANSYVVAGMSVYQGGTAVSVTANAGSLRTSIASSAGTVTTGIALVDITSGSIGSETTSLTGSAAASWANVAIELIPN
jgi:hypothetical protein